jgi:hypothetical protein
MRPPETLHSLDARDLTSSPDSLTQPQLASITARLRETLPISPPQPFPSVADVADDMQTAPLRAAPVTAAARPAPSSPQPALELQVQAPRKIAEARPRTIEEPAVRRPRVAREDPPATRVIVREVPRPLDPPVQRPPAPAPKAPRTAAEASVIGPLGRPERLLAQLDLRLR